MVDVGAYVPFDDPSEIDFILDSAGKTLIDQYGGSLDLAEQAEPGVTRISADPQATEVTYPFTVTSQTSSFMVGLSWASGTPGLTLETPSGQIVNTRNAASHGLHWSWVASSPQMLLYSAKNAAVGSWKARISNVEPTNHYHFIYQANRRIPAITNLAPANNVTVTSNNTSSPLLITWQAPAGASSQRVSLYYNATLPTTTAVQTGLIRQDLPITQGSFSWDLSYLPRGSYKVFARISDGSQRVKPAEGNTPRMPGYVEVYAPGTITLVDNTPPATPAAPSYKAFKDSLEACWFPPSVHDLAGYVLTYSATTIVGTPSTRRLRVPATVGYSAISPKQQCARIGGLTAYGSGTLQLATYDNSGNLSLTSPATNYSLLSYGNRPGRPGKPSATAGGAGSATISWPSVGGLSYTLHYWGNDQDQDQADGTPRTVDVGSTGSRTISGLRQGCEYSFAVQARDSGGRLSELSEVITLLLSSGTDRDGDGMADNWEGCHGVDVATQDADGDGMSNREEYLNKTNPRIADSDGDGFSDGEEALCGGNPRSAASFCRDSNGRVNLGARLPRLEVSPQRGLTFRAYVGGTNPAGKTITVANTGGGTLTTTATDSAVWLSLTKRGSDYYVSVNKQGLAPGHYQASVTISGAAGSRTQDSPQSVLVNLWVYPGTPNAQPGVFLPLMIHKS